MTNHDTPRCECGYRLADHAGVETPCPYHGMSRVRLTREAIVNHPVFAVFSLATRERIAQGVQA